MTLANWLSKAAVEEQTSALLLILKVNLDRLVNIEILCYLCRHTTSLCYLYRHTTIILDLLVNRFAGSLSFAFT